MTSAVGRLTLGYGIQSNPRASALEVEQGVWYATTSLLNQSSFIAGSHGKVERLSKKKKSA